MRKSLVIHPFMFAMFPVLFLLAHNIAKVPTNIWTTEIIKLIAITTASTLLLWLLLSYLLKDYKKAGVIVSIFLVLFFSYGHVWNVIRQPQPDGVTNPLAIGGFIIARHRYLLPAEIVLLFLSSYFVIKTRRNLHDITNILNIVATSLVVMSVANVGVYGLSPRVDLEPGFAWQDNTGEDREVITSSSIITGGFPDIYYIILDGYTSARVLNEFYGYDNHEFISYLTDKGFYIPSDAHSNYPLTILSLPSSLNMQHMDAVSKLPGAESQDWSLTYPMIKDSRVMRLLKSKGYKFIHLGSGWGPTAQNENADWDIQCGILNDFHAELIQSTMLRAMEVTFGPFAYDKRRRTLCTFSTLAEVQHRIQGPRFVFSHIVAPHPPYVFGQNGELVLNRVTDGLISEQQLYLDQLIFVNEKVKVLVDKILLEADTLPIIILQGDHGAAFDSYGQHPVEDTPSVKLLRERFGILNAYYLPNDGKDNLFDSITPVNTFRLIFNHYFKMSYDLLDDTIWFSPYEQPFKLIDITDILMN